MRKIFNLSLANIRKGKGQAASFILIMAICSMLMSMGFVTIFDYTESFDKKSKQLNAPDFVIAARTAAEDEITKLNDMLADDEAITQISSQPVMLSDARFDFAGETNSRFLALFDGAVNQDMGKMSIIEESDEGFENPIILPYLFKLGGGFDIGDEFKLTFDNTSTFTFTVSGFYEDIYFSTINTTTMGLILPHETYLNIEEQLNFKNSGVLFSLKTANPNESEALSLKYRKAFTKALPDNTLIDTVNYWIVKTSRTLTASIGSLIIVGFSLLLTLVALIVVNFRIKSSIDDDMKNIGALKAMGYTSKQLMLSFLIQFLVLGLAGAAAGIVCSYPAMPILSNMFAAQSGLIWNQLPTPVAIGLTILILAAAISAVAAVSTARIKKIHPITALRTGIQTHSFKKNSFPLDKTRLSLMASLSFKQLTIDIKQGMLTCIIMIIISFTGVFAVVMYHNFVNDLSAFKALGAAPYFHYMLTASTPQEAEEMIKEIQSREDTDKAIIYANNAMQYEGEHTGIVYTTDDIEELTSHNPVFLYDGRYPKHENEVAINGLIAATLEKKPGDTILVGDSSKKHEYIITGFIQGSGYMGRDMYMTNGGYKRIMPDYQLKGIVGFMKDTGDIDSLLADIKSKFPNTAQATNYDDLINSTMSIYTDIVSKIAIIICIISVLMIWLILYLIINTMLIKKKRDFGIQKTLGFTTRQLILQNVTSVIPVVGIGALIGCVMGYFLINPFISLIFTNIGICKTNLAVTPLMCIGIFTAVIAAGTFIAVMLSRKIRKISPYTLITE